MHFTSNLKNGGTKDIPLFIWWKDKFSPYIFAFSTTLPDWNDKIKDWPWSCRNQYNKNIYLFRLHNFPVQIYNFNKSAGLIYALKADIVCSCWGFFFPIRYCIPGAFQTPQVNVEKRGNLNEVSDVSMAMTSTQIHDYPLTQRCIFRHRGGGVSHYWPLWREKENTTLRP